MDRRRALLVLTLALVAALLFLLLRGGGETAAPPPAAKPTPVAPTKPALRPERPRSLRSETPTSESEPDAPPAKPASSPADGSTGVSVEVVSEDGVPLRDGTLDFEGTDGLQMMKRGMSPLFYLKGGALAGANPFVLRDLPDDADGLDVQAAAHVPGFPPAAVRFQLHLRKMESVRLVVAKGQSVQVRVVEEDGDTPIAGASVVSTSELTLRKIEPAAARGKPGPGSAVTDVRGECVVGELSAGGQELEIEAPDHQRATVAWTEGPVVVRLRRVEGFGSVTVTVHGPDGKPAEGVVVVSMEDDRKATTGKDGRASFDRVPAGEHRLFRLDFASIPDVHDWMDAIGSGFAHLGDVRVEPGGRHELDLGVRLGSATLDLRLVDGAGAPIVGAEVTVFPDLSIVSATTDAAGRARFEKLPVSKVTAWVDLWDVRWELDEIDVPAGARVERGWTFGAETLSGVVVGGPERKPIEGAQVHVSGPLSGSTGSRADGRFAFPRLVPGRYRLTATINGDHVARAVAADVPGGKDVVLELVRVGRVAVRFAAADRALLRDAIVSLRAKDGATPSLARPTSGDDDLVADELLPGAYEVVVELSGRTRAFAAEVKGGETTTVEVRAP